MKLLAVITGDSRYVESLIFRKEGETKTMDMHLKNMMDRKLAEGKAEDVMNLMETMGWNIETTLANMKVCDEEKPAIRKIVEEKMQGVPA